jgi:membrane-associated phospholipid phosphatase
MNAANQTEDGFQAHLAAAGRAVAANLARRWPAWLGALLLVAAAGWWVILPLDDYWLHQIQAAAGSGGARMAAFIGGSGDYLEFNLAACLLLWLGGRKRARREWRRAAAAGLVAMLLAGLTVNLLRPLCGRPRPVEKAAGTADTCYWGRGLTAGYRFQSFPSAHTATAFGTAIPVLLICPAAGVPLTAYAAVMAWSRMVQNAHHPSDVWVGAALGCLFGWAAARRPTRRREPAGSQLLAVAPPRRATGLDAL